MINAPGQAPDSPGPRADRHPRDGGQETDDERQGAAPRRRCSIRGAGRVGSSWSVEHVGDRPERHHECSRRRPLLKGEAIFDRQAEDRLATTPRNGSTCEGLKGGGRDNRGQALVRERAARSLSSWRFSASRRAPKTSATRKTVYRRDETSASQRGVPVDRSATTSGKDRAASARREST